MTTNFTFRDFLVYFTTGIIFVFTVGLVYYKEIYSWSVIFFKTNSFITDFSFLVTIFLIPAVYLLGHLIASIDFLLLKYFKWLHNKIKNIKRLRWWLNLNEVLFYKHRNIYRVVVYCKQSKDQKVFTNPEDFWILCAKLQKEKIYEYAGYWYILNDLFKCIHLVFIIGLITALYHQCWELFFIFSVLALFSYMRAAQFAKFFVDTITRQSRLLT